MSVLLAIALTLASTNDYKFVQMPTNWTPQIVGLGCGPDDTSAAIRAEDVFFLNEAMREREFVARTLSSPATTNSQPAKTTVWYLATPIPMSSHMLELGNSSTNLFSGLMTSNAVGFVTQPKAADWNFDHGLPGEFTTNLYTTGIPPSSHRYWDCHVDARWKPFGTAGYPYPMIVRGVCTNLYHDLAANTFVSFIQQMRTGPSGIDNEINMTSVNDAFAIGYSDRDDAFNFQNDYDIRIPQHISSRFSTAYEDVLSMSVTGTRRAYVGIRDGSVSKSGTGSQKSVQQQARYTGTFSITYSNPICGTVVNGVRAAFAALVMDVEERSSRAGSPTETVRKIVRRGVYPISFSEGPSDSGGCPSIIFTLDGQSVMQTALALFNESVKSPDELLARCPNPDYPQPGSGDVFKLAENWESYTITVSVPYVIAVAEVDFRAKERNNQ